MCGIICVVSGAHCSEKIKDMETNLKSRGPDHFGELRISLGEHLEGYFAASVLHTQGLELTPQPVFSNNNILLWNGDVFGGDLVQYGTGEDISDTMLITRWLAKNNDDVIKLVTLIEGPYAFIYYNSNRKCIWIARDPLGRHSLLWSVSGSELYVTSVARKCLTDLEEMPAAGIFCVYFNDEQITDVHLFPWSHYNPHEPTLQLPASITIYDAIPYFDFQQHKSKTDSFYEYAQTMDNMLSVPVIEACVNKVLLLLTASVRKRVTTQRNTCRDCGIGVGCSTEHCKVGVLFSGGLDSTVIACIADRFIPKNEPIDLLNVAFCKNGKYDAPDRGTGLQSVQELRSLCPAREWNFVEINVTEEELNKWRQDHICHLIHPLKTVLDESLGCALWFASRGKGVVGDSAYTSSAKIILMGNGADEQLGGYMRHRNLLKRSGWEELGRQLLKETIDISKRNMGRDNRVASDHGRQPRYPFLDENLVRYISELPPWHRCDPVTFAPGFGDKLILRLVALKLGLKLCACFPKRAFQFGSRIAKSKEKGDECSERL